MNCESFCEKLSAYLDGELNAGDELEVRTHFESCGSCCLQMEQFVAIGDLIRRSEDAAQAIPTWDAIEHRLDRAAVLSPRPMTYRSTWTIAALATAASFFLLWLAASSFRDSNHDDHDVASNGHAHPSMAVDFQDVFQSAQTDPQAAIGRLVMKYQGLELDRKGAVEYLGYEPALFQTVPVGFTRTSTHVLNMPCCKCSATICQRQDGTSLVFFEHKDEQPVWFGNAPSTDTQCAGKPCKIIESAGNLAVTWKSKGRQLTMIGAKDKTEVDQWITNLSM